MKTFFKLIHVCILVMIVITGNDIYDQILNSIIAVIAFIYAFIFTRNISDELEYNSILMSLVHWTARTVFTILMMLVTRLLYLGLINIFSGSIDNGAEILSIISCSIIWIVIAEVLKSITGLRKSY